MADENVQDPSMERQDEPADTAPAESPAAATEDKLESPPDNHDAAPAMPEALDNKVVPTLPESAEVKSTVDEAIPEQTEPKAAGKAKSKPKVSTTEPKDIVREIAETVVFVIVLVLLLKTFIAEAFVIPTGSMATTLWGYQKIVDCPECGFTFPVNCSKQVEPEPGDNPVPVESCTCPNCLFRIAFPSPYDEPPWNSGDRVLVFKSWYDSGLGSPHRHDVVVFKYPVQPQDNNRAMNYIKRLIGLPGETIAIQAGQLFVYDQPRTVPKPEHYWSLIPRGQFTWPQDSDGLDLFENGKFRIIQKAPDKILALRRVVYDNDHQAADLVKNGQAPRWQGDSAWQPDEAGAPKAFTISDVPLAWLRYHHLRRDTDQHGKVSEKASLITDVMGYNTANGEPLGSNWVGDLLVECNVKIEDGSSGELRLELSRGVDRFQARFDLTTGNCKLIRLQTEKGGGIKETELGQAETTLRQGGSYHVRFANFDRRLTLWVDDELPFDDGVAYPVPWQLGPTNNDLQPAGVAAQAANVTISQIKLWRDTYYTVNTGRAHLGTGPAGWDSMRKPEVETFYIQPGYYLCLGDNSPQSSDSRFWGMVPERLMLGRALMVYFPFKLPIPPINLPVNRVGIIH